MSENIRAGKRIKEGEKGDGKCYFHCKICCTRRPERVLIATTKKHCRKYGHMDGGSNEYRPMVISYICIHYLFKYLLYSQTFILFYTCTNFS
jgi:hypothetical protein